MTVHVLVLYCCNYFVPCVPYVPQDIWTPLLRFLSDMYRHFGYHIWIGCASFWYRRARRVLLEGDGSCTSQVVCLYTIPHHLISWRILLWSCCWFWFSTPPTLFYSPWGASVLWYKPSVYHMVVLPFILPIYHVMSSVWVELSTPIHIHILPLAV